MPPITLSELPSPPPGKTGWPWTTTSDPFPVNVDAPKISIVTPSFNQSQFLEETIRSVLLQNYPNLEYIVMDAASNDDSVHIIKKYAPFLTYWTSAKDNGQSDAINKGFTRATGQYLAWQNSDDIYSPNAFSNAIANAHPAAAVIYGQVDLINANSHITGRARTSNFNLLDMFPWANMFNQSMFFHRRVIDAGLFLDPTLRHYLDHEFFWRIILAGYRFQYIPAFKSCFRIHDLAKGATQPVIAANELHSLYKTLALNPALTDQVHNKILNSMRGLCLDQFGKSRWELFEQFTADLLNIAGHRGLGTNLLVKRILAKLGGQNIDRLRKALRKQDADAA